MEFEFINWLKARLGMQPGLLVPFGDDTTGLKLASDRCLVTVDLISDQVDFDLARHDPHRIGRKALAVNLSDIAAMAGRPVAAVVAVALPRGSSPDLAPALYEGMLPLARHHEVVIAGGDTNTHAGPLTLSVTLIAEPSGSGPLLRSGARPGDRIVVTGSFGGSILGRHFDFDPRVPEALLLYERYELHAGIDVSDGLVQDLGHIAEESGVGAVVDINKVPVAEAAAELAQQDGRSPLEHALGDGEDFELILAVPPKAAEAMLREQPLDIPLTDIGEFVAEPGLRQRDAAGNTQPLSVPGYQHQL